MLLPPAAVTELVSVQLFNGCTTYSSESQIQQQLQEMMSGNKASAKVLLSLRGKVGARAAPQRPGAGV